MSTGQQQRPQHAATKQVEAPTEFERLMRQSRVKYTPFGETDEIDLSFAQVRNFISARTKKGMLPNDEDIVKFLMLCKARLLNPWVGDAYLVGYDTQDGPVFSLITAIQALFKRAEANPNFNGIQSGVIVQNARGEIIEREGDFTLPAERLVGSWCKVFRRDRDVSFYDALKLGTYDKGFGQWKNDKEGMIVKCAEASALRKAFPSQLSGLYVSQEEDAIRASKEIRETVAKAEAKTLSDLIARERKAPAEVAEHTADEPQAERDTLADYRDQLSRAATEQECRDLYERCGNPEVSGWTPEQDRQANAEMLERIAAVKGGGK